MSLRSTLDSLAPKPKVKQVDMTKEWGCKPYIRKLSWGDLKRVQSLDDPAKQVCAVLCDEDGKQLYNEDEAHLLEKFHADDLKKVLDAATSFNSLDEQVKQAKND
ncbi:hypothetical protein [Thalassoglobus sp.]|uniref:hypothetical protein n=1 Tax=Thalassoglobus sp. TaxID=2795869 RepID=UPI003AA9C11A